MKAPHCCQIKAGAGGGVRQRRRREIVGWIVPGITLVLMPKCPMCVAAYLAVATGVGISLPTAAFMRTALVVVCIGSLVFMAARRLRMSIARRAVR